MEVPLRFFKRKLTEKSQFVGIPNFDLSLTFLSRNEKSINKFMRQKKAKLKISDNSNFDL